MVVFRAFMFGALAVVWGGSAQAALKFCNETEFKQSVSIGYQGTDDWASEGWWNVDPGACATTIAGDLTFRYYYYRAEVDGGDFDGENYFFCTSPDEYTIIGDAECESRGHDREKFREIDVGEGITDFTLTMTTDATAAPALAPVTPAQSVDPGLRVCNETTDIQAVSIAYDGPEGWTSEGWWNVSPDQCATVIGGALKQRYYYYRTEVDGADFPGGTFAFCTSPQEYTIVGEADCEARGYDTEKFDEIDTGQDATGYTLTLTPVSAAPEKTPPPTTAPETGTGLTVCNQTDSRQEVSIGYQRGSDWVSEGWWNVEIEECVKVLGDALTQQFYYYRTEIGGGDFAGGGYFFCTTPEAYEIVGDADCEARGYDREDFAEISIGSNVPEFTYTLTGSGASETPTAPTPVPAPVADPAPVAAEGLRICNETPQVQSVSIGYQNGEDWTSEGWWNLEQQQCATVLPGELQKRYYYYRAEVDGGPFTGEGYGFCTSPTEYTIVGDTECEERGYDREDFSEIDTGPTAKSFVFTISDTSGPAVDEPELFEETVPEGVPTPDQTTGPEAAPGPGPGSNTGADERTPLAPAAPPAAPEPEPEPAPEPEPVPEPEPEPEPVPVPEVVDPMAEPEPAAPVTPRRGGSRG